MVHFVGAGSGAPDLITVRGARLLGEADVVIYAGSLVNPALLDATKPGCEIHDSAKMTLEEVIAVIRQAEAEGKKYAAELASGAPAAAHKKEKKAKKEESAKEKKADKPSKEGKDKKKKKTKKEED